MKILDLNVEIEDLILERTFVKNTKDTIVVIDNLGGEEVMSPMELPSYIYSILSHNKSLVKIFNNTYNTNYDLKELYDAIKTKSRDALETIKKLAKILKIQIRTVGKHTLN